MVDESLREIAMDRALALPATALTYPFGDEWDVFKVRDKVFMLTTERQGRPMVTLKAAPADVHSLCAAHDEITPGYHMNKLHWITLVTGEGLDAELVEDLVVDSYLLVLTKNVPRRDWPVDPATFR